MLRKLGFNLFTQNNELVTIVNVMETLKKIELNPHQETPKMFFTCGIIKKNMCYHLHTKRYE